MATTNGIGTLRYDWAHHADGTAEATLSYVCLLLPVIPIERQRVRVLDEGLERINAKKILAFSLFVYGQGWRTSIEVLGRVPMKVWPILRTYAKGFIVTPLVTCIGPFMILSVVTTYLEEWGVSIRKYQTRIYLVCGILIALWAAVIISRILDRAAGRRTRVQQGKSTLSQADL